ncbi:MAG: quinohemoprotein amine dehydrogenase subunit alpha [Acidobacteriota bacterium]|nr:quinohemoprotein amine dehydrogenase subunit alpha [Acidobacteriota bacterium]
MFLSRMSRVHCLWLLWMLAASTTTAQPTDSGIPIDDPTVRQACSRCHQADDEGRLSRISFRRTTPEGWQQTIRRMVTLNDVALTPETAREVVRYLANHLGLAPEEARQAAYEVERRADDQPYEDADVQNTCTQCHSMGRVISQRRTEEEWRLLMAMHRGYYPFTDFQAFRRGGAPSDEPEPVDQAVTHLSERFPLDTTEWSAWAATMRPARVGGTWLLRGHAPGLGGVYGRVTITPVPDTDDEFTTSTTYVYARDGRRVTRTGRAVIYTGFQWRGRSFVDDVDADGLREVMFVERDWRTMTGRWFAGAYDEDGLDITLERATGAATVAGVHPTALAVDTTQTIRVYGLSLSLPTPATAIDLGPGVTVLSVEGGTGEWIDIAVQVDADATVGRRDLVLGQTAVANALTVYDTVHRIGVTPAAGMARVGGGQFPKQYQQFEAKAYHNGPDNEPNTEDDIDLGVVDVRWSLEEYAVTVGDDDLDYVGHIDDTGRFDPAIDGPNPERSGDRNNVGDVWVVASYPVDPRGENELRARGHLLVTVPLYMRWDPSAVEQP